MAHLGRSVRRSAMRRIQLAGFWPLAHAVALDGSLTLLGGDRGDVTTLVTVSAEGSCHIEPLAYIGDAWLNHLPTLLALPTGGCAVVVDLERLFVHPAPGDAPRRVTIGNAGALTLVNPAPRVYRGAVVGAAGRFDVVLAHGSQRPSWSYGPAALASSAWRWVYRRGRSPCRRR